MKSVLPINSRSFFAAFCCTAALSCESRKKCSHDTRQVDALREETRHDNDSQHHGEICALIVLYLSAESKRPNRLRPRRITGTKIAISTKLQSQAGDREATLKCRDADCEHDQRKRVGEHRRPIRNSDWLEFVFS